MIQEQFPAAASLRTQWAQWRDQGDVLSCSAQGPANALSTMLQRSTGTDINLSARFLWWNLRGKEKSIDSAALTLQSVGTCLDSLCLYDIALLDSMPEYAAWQDAKARLPQFSRLRAIPIAGAEGVKRAIGQGSAITFKMGDSSEHISCIDGYNADGVEIWDSNSIKPSITMPWSDLEGGGRITQLRRWAGIPLVPHADYVEGDVPTLIGGVLSLPKAMVYVGFPEPSIWFKNIKLNITDTGRMTSGNDDVRDIVFWHSLQATLYIPKLIVDSKILHGVKMEKPLGTLISAEEA